MFNITHRLLSILILLTLSIPTITTIVESIDYFDLLFSNWDYSYYNDDDLYYNDGAAVEYDPIDYITYTRLTPIVNQLANNTNTNSNDSTSTISSTNIESIESIYPATVDYYQSDTTINNSIQSELIFYNEYNNSNLCKPPNTADTITIITSTNKSIILVLSYNNNECSFYNQSINAASVTINTDSTISAIIIQLPGNLTNNLTIQYQIINTAILLSQHQQQLQHQQQPEQQPVIVPIILYIDEEDYYWIKSKINNITNTNTITDANNTTAVPVIALLEFANNTNDWEYYYSTELDYLDLILSILLKSSEPFIIIVFALIVIIRKYIIQQYLQSMRESRARSIPIVKYQHKTSNNSSNPDNTIQIHNSSCCICLSDFDLFEPVILLQCKHAFHSDCYIPWSNKSANCPYCQISILDNNTAPLKRNRCIELCCWINKRQLPR